MLGNGVTTSFSWSFNNAVPTGQSTSEASYTVIYTSPTGVETTLAASTYTLSFTAAAVGSLWGNGGTLLYPLTGSPIASGSTLTLIRTFPLTQTTTISNQGDVSPQVIEEMGDTLEMQIQQVNNRTTQWRGTWLSGVVYNPGDIVQDGANGAGTNNWYLCLVGNTSGTWSTDLAAGDWTLSVQATAPTTNQPITLSGAVTGTGQTTISTSFGQVAASSFLGNLATASGTATAISLATSTLAGRGSAASGGATAITMGNGMIMSATAITVAISTASQYGLTKPDNNTITVNGSGALATSAQSQIVTALAVGSFIFARGGSGVTFSATVAVAAANISPMCFGSTSSTDTSTVGWSATGDALAGTWVPLTTSKANTFNGTWFQRTA